MISNNVKNQFFGDKVTIFDKNMRAYLYKKGWSDKSSNWEFEQIENSFMQEGNLIHLKYLVWAHFDLRKYSFIL